MILSLCENLKLHKHISLVTLVRKIHNKLSELLAVNSCLWKKAVEVRLRPGRHLLVPEENNGDKIGLEDGDKLDATDAAVGLL